MAATLSGDAPFMGCVAGCVLFVGIGNPPPSRLSIGVNIFQIGFIRCSQLVSPLSVCLFFSHPSLKKTPEKTHHLPCKKIMLSFQFSLRNFFILFFSFFFEATGASSVFAFFPTYEGVALFHFFFSFVCHPARGAVSSFLPG